MDDVDARLRRIRGGVDPVKHNARTIAALTSNPGCIRRAVLDAAGVDKEKLARATGHPTSISRLSDFALARGKAFEAQVKAEGCADLLRLLRSCLDLPIPQVHYEDLNSVGGAEGAAARYVRSRQALAATAGGGPDTGTLFDHPMLRLKICGVWAYLEPDLVAFRIGTQFYIVEIKSFPILYGRAEPDKVAAAAMQSAVYVTALRSMLQDLGFDPTLVADQVVLVCPKDFTNQPTASLIDVRKPLGVLRRRLARAADVAALLRDVPAGVTFHLAEHRHGAPVRTAAQLLGALREIEARYAPECLSTCEMALFCREEARGMTAVLGRTVREDLGGVESARTALALATGRLKPTPDLAQAAELLQLAQRMRAECLGGAA